MPRYELRNMSGSCGLWAVGRPGGILLDAGAAKPARDWGNGTTPTIKALRRTRSWEGIQQAGTRAGGESEGASQQMVRIGASGSRRGGSARPRARRGAAWGEAQKAHRGLSRQFLQRPQSLARQAVHAPQRCDFGLVRDLESAAASSRAFASAARWNSWEKVICGLVGAGTG